MLSMISLLAILTVLTILTILTEAGLGPRLWSLAQKSRHRISKIIPFDTTFDAA